MSTSIPTRPGTKSVWLLGFIPLSW